MLKQDPNAVLKEHCLPNKDSNPVAHRQSRIITNRAVPFGDLDGLDEISMNIGKFNSDKFKISKGSYVVKKKRNASEPDPNQIPYKIYKKYPRIMNYTFRIMLIAVRDKVIPVNWRVCDGIMIPKVQNPRQSNLADYRQIALGNVEGKFF